MRVKQAILLAGGKGTRLSEISGELPKSMVSIAGRPVLAHALERLKNFGIRDVHFFTGFQSSVIEQYFGTGEKFGMRCTYHIEDTPMGTAGGVVNALSELDEEFLVIYGDTIFNIDISKLENFHLRKKSDATLFLHPNDHPFDSDLVEIDEHGRIIALYPCPHSPDNYLPNMVSAALYVMRKEALMPWASHTGKLDFAHDIFPVLIAQKRRMFGYQSREYVKDMGTPERFKKVESDLVSGKVDRGSYATPRPAIFIDRDGTLTQSEKYVRRPEELVLGEGSAEAVKMINSSKYLSVMITNQPVVARGEVTEDELKTIHNKMEQDFGKHHAFLDALYYCPHHPDKGFKGERVEYKMACECRKPGIKLIQKASADLHIKMGNSWFIGDSTVDLMTAKNAGLRSVLVRTGYGGADRKYDIKPDFEAANLLEAVRIIVG